MYKEYEGFGVKIELMQDENVLTYRMYGQSIAEQVGTTNQDEVTLLAVLLESLGMKVRGQEIVPDFARTLQEFFGNQPEGMGEGSESGLNLPHTPQEPRPNRLTWDEAMGADN